MDASLFPLSWHQLDNLRDDPYELLAALGEIARLGFTLVPGRARHAALHRPDRLHADHQQRRHRGHQGRPARYDLSITPRALKPHTDNPYRVPQPGYVLLHCLANDADGGESGLTDGFHVADRMRREHPGPFGSLCTVPVAWRYADDQAVLEDTSPLIDLGPGGSVTHVRFHGRADRVAAVDPDALDAFFTARRIFSGLIRDDAMQLRFQLGPGEMFMIDNYRIIHSRSAFRLQTGSRHMRQAYIDRTSSPAGTRRG